MPFTLRQFEQEDNFSQQVSLDAFLPVIPPARLEEALATSGPVKTRNRRLTLQATMWLVIVMHLFSQCSISHAGWRVWSEGCVFSGQIPVTNSPETRRCPIGAINEAPNRS